MPRFAVSSNVGVLDEAGCKCELVERGQRGAVLGNEHGHQTPRENANESCPSQKVASRPAAIVTLATLLKIWLMLLEMSGRTEPAKKIRPSLDRSRSAGGMTVIAARESLQSAKW